MNPLTNVRNLAKMNERELELNVPENASWHQMYKDSSWIFFGGVDTDLTEGDLICVFSQWGEVVNIHLVRDRTTGKSKGFGFLAFYNQKSTVLAVDNANGIKLCGRTLRVDHCENYKIPKNLDKMDPETRELIEKGCAPQAVCVKKAETMDRDARKSKHVQDDVREEKKKSKRRDESREDRKEHKKRRDDKDEMKNNELRKDEFRKDEYKRNESRHELKQDERRMDDFRREDDFKWRNDEYRDSREEFKRTDDYKRREDDSRRRNGNHKQRDDYKRR